MSYIGLPWCDLLQSIAIVLGLAFTSASLSLDVRTRKTQLHLALAESHREIGYIGHEGVGIFYCSRFELPFSMKVTIASSNTKPIIHHGKEVVFSSITLEPVLCIA